MILLLVFYLSFAAAPLAFGTEVKSSRPLVSYGGDLAPPKVALSETEKASPLFVYADKSANGQVMHVFKLGEHVKSYPISTGREVGESNYSRPGFRTYCSSTTEGTYRPTRTYAPVYNSQLWGGAKMYCAMFYFNGEAIHGVDESLYHRLGQRASGACIRMKKEDSCELYDWMEQVGRSNMLIRVEDNSPNIERYKIEDNCMKQQRVVKCTQRELQKAGVYNKDNRVTYEVNGKSYTKYEVDRSMAYQIEEQVCRPRLQASGEMYLGPPRYSMRPVARPQGEEPAVLKEPALGPRLGYGRVRPSDRCVDQDIDDPRNPCSPKFRDGLY